MCIRDREDIQNVDSLYHNHFLEYSKNLVMGDGDINSPIMLIGEAPDERKRTWKLKHFVEMLAYY